MSTSFTILALALVGLAGSSSPSSAVVPCSTTTVAGATVQNWCGPAKATVELAGKTLTFKGGVCGVVPGGLGDGKSWALNIGKVTIPPAKPKFPYFSVAGRSKAGTYAKGEFLITFALRGKFDRSSVGPGWGLPWTKVTIVSGGKKGSFSGHAFLGGIEEAARLGLLDVLAALGQRKGGRPVNNSTNTRWRLHASWVALLAAAGIALALSFAPKGAAIGEVNESLRRSGSSGWPRARRCGSRSPMSSASIRSPTRPALHPAGRLRRRTGCRLRRAGHPRAGARNRPVVRVPGNRRPAPGRGPSHRRRPDAAIRLSRGRHHGDPRRRRGRRDHHPRLRPVHGPLALEEVSTTCRPVPRRAGRGGDRGVVG